MIDAVAPVPITAVALAPVPNVAVADAPVPGPAPGKLKVGAAIGPVQEFTIVIDYRPPLPIAKVPVHPLPPPPLTPKGYVPSVYSLPPITDVVPVIPDVMVIVGVLIYPDPALGITKDVIIPEPVIGVIIAEYYCSTTVTTTT
jgi:hypothetical protein